MSIDFNKIYFQLTPQIQSSSRLLDSKIQVCILYTIKMKGE